MRLSLPLMMLWAGAIEAQPVCPLQNLQALTPGVESWFVPSISMKPALDANACFVTVRQEDYAPGDIIAFRDDVAKTSFVFRLIAVGGQSVQMIDGALHIDGKPVPRHEVDPYPETYERQGTTYSVCPDVVPVGGACDIAQYEETLGGKTYRTLDLGDGAFDNTGVFEVPDGHVFVMGDHRDNATDSRVPPSMRGRGFVPVENIIGTMPQP